MTWAHVPPPTPEQQAIIEKMFGKRPLVTPPAPRPPRAGSFAFTWGVLVCVVLVQYGADQHLLAAFAVVSWAADLLVYVVRILWARQRARQSRVGTTWNQRRPHRGTDVREN